MGWAAAQVSPATRGLWGHLGSATPRHVAMVLGLLCARLATAQLDGGRVDAGTEVPSYGPSPMVMVAPDVFVDPSTTPEERARLATTITSSRARLAEALGPLESPVPLGPA